MQAYHTLALTHYWGFKWLDALRLNCILLAIVLFIVGYVLFFLCEIFLLSNPYGDGGPPTELKIVFSATAAILVAVWIALARGAQADLLEIQKSGLVSRAPMEGLIQNSRFKRCLELFFGTLFGLSLYTIGRATVEKSGFIASVLSSIEDLAYFYAMPYLILSWLAFAIVGICTVRLATFIWKQSRLFLNVEKKMRIDLLETEPLSVFANQPLRTVVGTIVLVSSGLIMGDLDGIVGQTYYTVGMPLQLVMLISTIIVSPPLWSLRRRVRTAKRRELKKIRKAIMGDNKALIGSRIEFHRDDFDLPDLLYYEDRISSVWEWPFHVHVRRMAFYVIIPPAAWLMSALVEILVDSVLIVPPQ